MKHPAGIDKVTARHAEQALHALHTAGELAWQAFFAGIAWPEGAHYCRNTEYIRLTAAPMLAKHNARSVYWLHNRIVAV